jgi:hypothetical protein
MLFGMDSIASRVKPAASVNHMPIIINVIHVYKAIQNCLYLIKNNLYVNSVHLDVQTAAMIPFKQNLLFALSVKLVITYSTGCVIFVNPTVKHARINMIAVHVLKIII